MLFTKKPDGTLVLVEGDELTIHEEIADIDEAQRKTRILLGKADDDDEEEEEDEDVASVVEQFFEWRRRPSPPPNSPASDAGESESEVTESDVTADQDVAKPEPVMAGI